MVKKQTLGNMAVGAFIQNGEGLFLLIQRPNHCSYCPTCWEVPGGKMDPGEKPEQAVVREVLEETGLSIELDEVIGEADFKAKGKQLVMRYWRARVIDGEVRLSQEHQAYQWLLLGDFRTQKLTPALETILTKMINNTGN